MTNTSKPFVILAPPALLPQAAAIEPVATPYGTAYARNYEEAWWMEPADAKTLIYATKELEALYVIHVLAVQSLNHLLSAGDFLLPDNLIDLTWEREQTFFVNKGYGFLPQDPPFCPDLRSVLLNATHQTLAALPFAERPRVFGRGTYAVMEQADVPLDDQVSHLLHVWGADAFGDEGVPISFLARELELCYAPLGYTVARSDGKSVHADNEPADTATDMPGDLLMRIIVTARTNHHMHPRTCVCASAMQKTRERGLVGNDWHTWVGVSAEETGDGGA
jgi:5'-methylthioadenosine phosphorylase